MEQIHVSFGQQYPLPVNDYRSSIKQPNWMYSEPKYQQIGYNPWVSPYARPGKNFKSDGYLPSQIPQIAPWQRYYESQRVIEPNKNNPIQKFYQFVQPNSFRPTPIFPFAKVPLPQRSDKLLPNYYSTNIPSPINLDKIPHNPYSHTYTLKEKPVGYYNYPWYPTNPHLRTPVPSVDAMNQPHLDDDFDDMDNLNENVNTNLKDSKFLQLIMKHLKGLIIMKDDNDGMHPKDDLI